MSVPTPPSNLGSTEDRAKWLASLSDADRTEFMKNVIATAPDKEVGSWRDAIKTMQSDKSKYNGPNPPANLTDDQKVQWLAGLSDKDRSAFLDNVNQSYKNEDKGILGVPTMQSFGGGEKQKDPWLAANKALDDQRKAGAAGAAPVATTSTADGLAPVTTGTTVKSNTDLLTDPVASAFSAAQLDQDFQVDTGQTTSAYRGSDLQSGVPVQASAKGKLSDLYSLDPTALEDLQKKLQGAGYLSKYTPGIVGDTTMQGYLQLMIDTAKHNKMGEQVSPDDLLGQAATSGQKNNTQTQINLTDPLTAKALIHSALTSALGRIPNPGEILDFTEALTNAEKANPSTSTTAQNPDGSTSTTSTGGVNDSAFAADYVQQNYGKDIGTFNAATSLYDAALSVLGAGGRGA